MLSKNIFSLVSTRPDRERLFQRLVDEKRTVQIQISKSKLLNFTVVDRDAAFLIVTCDEKVNILANQEVIVNFIVPPETFLMKTTLVNNRDQLQLNINADLFKVQRRDYFRLSFPQGYKAFFDLEKIGSKNQKETFSLFNLSGGGLSFEFQPEKIPDIKSGVEVEGTLRIGFDFKKSVRGKIRHIRMVGSMGSGLSRAGVQFQDISATDQEDVIKMVLAVHRDLFSRFKLG